MSPVLKVGVGLGYVKKEYAKQGTEFYIKVRNKNIKAEVTKLPFRK
jgi:aminomethyltransferase